MVARFIADLTGPDPNPTRFDAKPVKEAVWNLCMAIQEVETEAKHEMQNRLINRNTQYTASFLEGTTPLMLDIEAMSLLQSTKRTLGALYESIPDTVTDKAFLMKLANHGAGDATAAFTTFTITSEYADLINAAINRAKKGNRPIPEKVSNLDTFITYMRERQNAIVKLAENARQISTPPPPTLPS